jgi:hypothetical protein
MAGRPSTKTTTPKVEEEKVVVIDNTEELNKAKEENKQLADMLKQMQEQMVAMQSQINQPQQVILNQNSDATKVVKVTSLLPNMLNLTTEPNGKGKVYTFRKFGEVKPIPFTDLQRIIIANETFFEKGYVVLPSQKEYENLLIGHIYDTILSKETVEKVILLKDEESVDIILDTTEDMQEKLISLIAENIVKGVSYDYNKIKELEDEGLMINELVALLKESKEVKVEE